MLIKLSSKNPNTVGVNPTALEDWKPITDVSKARISHRAPNTIERKEKTTANPMYISLFKAEDKIREVNASFNAWEEKKNKKPLISYF